MIGHFYNGRDHSTVCHGIQRIKSLRETDPDVDSLIVDLKQQLDRERGETSDSEDANKDLTSIGGSKLTVDEFADLVAKRVCAYLEKQHLF
jgi:hypothetical protein